MAPHVMRNLAAQQGTQEAAGPTDQFTPGATPPTAQAAPEGSRAARRSGPPDLDLGDPVAAAERLRAVSDEGDLESLKQHRKDLKARSKETRQTASLREAAELHKNLTQTQGSIKRMERVQREMRWERLTDEEGRTGENAPSKTYQNFFETGRTPIGEMKEVLKIADELQDPHSSRRIHGNKLELLSRGEVWQTKMGMMESAAANPTKDGKPVNVDAEYFELADPGAIEKLGRAAKGGGNVRVLIDSGRLQADGEMLDATSLANRLNTVTGLETGSRGKAGVQFFANQEVLGSRGDLMHRKLLRVDDKVLFGGMNANAGSGENVDNAMTMEGPAARTQVEGFQRDLDRSQGRDVAAIFGTQLEDLRTKDNISVTPQGVLSLLEAAGKKAPQGNRRREERIDAAMESASYQGIRASDLVNIPDKDKNGAVSEAEEKAWLMGGRGSVQLTEQGRHFLADGLEAAVGRMNGKANLDRLQASELPSDRVVGTDTVAVGDTGPERTAMVLHAIDSAKERVDIEAFVVSEEVARALVDKRDRMAAEGKPFDARVVLDPGMYGYGGTPNEKGYRYLEDHGIPVKWAVLDRTDPHHDRKVHAKLMVTDQLMLTGSTNFSSKALRANHELSDIVYFGDDDKSRAKQAELRTDFDHLWNREAVGINTHDLAEQKFAETPPGPERDLLVERFRNKTMRGFIMGVENYEKAIGKQIEGMVHGDPSLAYNVEQRVRNGEARGYATMELIGDDKLLSMRESTPAYQVLQRIANQGS